MSGQCSPGENEKKDEKKALGEEPKADEKSKVEAAPKAEGQLPNEGN